MSVIPRSKQSLVNLLLLTFLSCHAVENKPRRTDNPDKFRHPTQLVKVGKSIEQGSIKAELPREFLKTAWVAPTGKTIGVGSGDNLQKALDRAQSGDEVVLTAGDTFTGSFLLAEKPGDGWITVRSNALDRLPEGKRVNPSQAQFMPKILSRNSAPAIRTQNRSARWRLVGLEVSVTPDVPTNYGLISLGEGQETTYNLITSDIVLDRMYIHGTPTCGCKRGVALHGSRQAVIDSYISEIHVVGQDTQAIAGWNGPGPYKIVNNYLEAAGENIIFGGADPSLFFRMKVQAGATTTKAVLEDLPPFSPGTPIMFLVGGKTGQHAYTVLRTINGNEAAYDELPDPPDANSMASVGVVPSDIEISRNTLFKPLSWKLDDPSYAGTHWTVKNLFELKSAQRVLLQGNWMENSWADGQAGGGLVLLSANQEGACTYCVIQDVTIASNVVKNTLQALGLIGHYGPSFQPATMQRVYIYNNLFYPSLRLFSFFKNVRNVWLENNTGFANYNTVVIEPAEAPFPGFVFRGNILERSAYGVGVGGEGAKFLKQYFPAFQWETTAIINSSEGTEGEQTNEVLQPMYPSGTILLKGKAAVPFADLSGAGKNYRGYELAPNSPLKRKGPGGKDYGVDFVELNSKLPAPIF